MGINWRSRIDIQEESRYGRAQLDRPHCRQCGDLIRDDDWRGGPVVGYLCGRCDELNGRHRDAAEVAKVGAM